MAVSPIGVSPGAAAQAYRAVESGQAAAVSGGADFGGVLSRMLESAVAAGHEADRQSTAAIAGNGNITDVVTAVSKAELALQSTVAIRDRVVQAYQDIMRMGI
ncbi:Flagellar hook-basal body complex protein FliE [Rhodovastum atsumiense]|uniref:Flagellar hook-basal body complex protein FliE n=1 Tax=Rhodovastum atsumiense TaxID=504468 RepID=A0A5M6IS39_9PROT|nr:flagellar hook-basal body complex protein FliE [Rhodovastum atsumiense]KAA5611113.1 flagellar hook-basal body complex protein FliE [Rhodovastum atsumiense]CAH2599178.1 Flagellar hook-basal body complex protein FliE [Rhodovastum atsumiense]